MDTFVYMVMLQPASDRSSVADFSDIVANYEVNAKGLHIVLHAAKEAGIQHAVYTSTFTVHERTRNNFPYEDVVPRDNPGVYGLTEDSSGYIWWTDEEDSVEPEDFDAFFIAGDHEQKKINLSKAKRLLGWEPLTHILVL